MKCVIFLRKHLRFGHIYFILISLMISLACNHEGGNNRGAQYDDDSMQSDAYLNRAAYSESFARENIYPLWDQDRDSLLNESEFLQGVFYSLDTDHNGYLSPAEWNILKEYNTNKFIAFKEVDENGDGRIDQTEYNDPVRTLTIYQDWDSNQDSYINQDEFIGGMFDVWDVNHDNRLSASEYKWKDTMEPQ